MKTDGKLFEVGQRFRLTDLGIERCPRITVPVGNIVGIPKHSAAIRVRFDGNKTDKTIHRDYIEPI